MLRVAKKINDDDEDDEEEDDSDDNFEIREAEKSRR